MKPLKIILRAVALCAALAMPLTACGCSFSKDKAIALFNDVITAAGSNGLTRNRFLEGKRDFGADGYTGEYSAAYDDFSGTEFIFGGTSLSRDGGQFVTVKCTLDITGGCARLIWLHGADQPEVLLEGPGTYEQVVELNEGANYFGIRGEGAQGSVTLTVFDAEEAA